MLSPSQNQLTDDASAQQQADGQAVVDGQPLLLEAALLRVFVRLETRRLLRGDPCANHVPPATLNHGHVSPTSTLNRWEMLAWRTFRDGSGSGGRKAVEVRVLSWAPARINRFDGRFRKHPGPPFCLPVSPRNHDLPLKKINGGIVHLRDVAHVRGFTSSAGGKGSVRVREGRHRRRAAGGGDRGRPHRVHDA
jgi:hypothetical protein